jgi:hypothetical protein
MALSQSLRTGLSAKGRLQLKTSSAKQKGRLLQIWVRELLIKKFNLEYDDVRSTSMGQSGEDIQFSPLAARRTGVSIECKSRHRIAVYSYYQQAKTNTPQEREPVVVIKQDRSKPLVVVDAEYFFHILERIQNDKQV